jgi:hypothetical protein
VILNPLFFNAFEPFTADVRDEKQRILWQVCSYLLPLPAVC